MADNYRSFLNLFHLFAEIALVVEITEEENEADTIAKHHNIHGVREVALREQVISCVRCQKHKLHLQEDRSKHKDQRLTNICVPDIVVIQPEQPLEQPWAGAQDKTKYIPRRYTIIHNCKGILHAGYCFTLSEIHIADLGPF